MMNEFTYQETLALAKRIENENPKELIVPSKLISPHPLVLRTKQHFKNLKSGFWSPLISTEEGFLSIRVTKQYISRALRFYDAFINLAESRGHGLVIVRHANYVIIRNEKLNIRLRETERVIEESTRNPYQSRKMEPTGIFCFCYDSYHPEKEWYDAKTVKLEDKLAVMMAYLELKADSEIRWKRECEINRRKEELERELKRQQQEMVDQERVKYNALLNNTKRWTQYVQLCDWIKRVEKDEYKSLEWIAWAKKKAEWVDPRTDDEDGILGVFQ